MQHFSNTSEKIIKNRLTFPVGWNIIITSFPIDWKTERSPHMENKKEIVALLLPVLQATRNLSDLIDLTLDETTEIVTATFSNGATKRANVAADSGTSMIRDIVGQIV